MSKMAELFQKSFDQAITDDKVRVHAEPEQESYFDVFGWGCSCDCESSPAAPCQHDQATIDYIDLHGLWLVYGQYRCPHCNEWKNADSVGMTTAEDPLDPEQNEYVHDLLFSAFAALTQQPE